MSSIKERLLQFLDHLGMGQSKFEKITGLSNGLINNIGDSIHSKTINKISEKYPELNTVWLLTGKEEMILANNIVEEAQPAYGRRQDNNLAMETIRDLAQSSIILADANKIMAESNKVLADNNRELIGICKTNFQIPKQISEVLKPYLEVIAVGLGNKLKLDPAFLLEELGSVLIENHLQTQKSGTMAGAHM